MRTFAKGAFASRGLILLAAALWGLNGMFVRFLTALGLTAVECVFLRQVTAATILGLYLLLFARDKFRIRLRDAWCFLGTGLGSLLLFNLCNYSAMQYTSLAVASVLLYTAPAFVTLLSALLFREKLTPAKGAALAVMFSGCLFVSGLLPYRGGLSARGIVLGLCAGFGYALYTIFGRFALRRGYSSATISFYSFLLCGAGCAPLADYQVIAAAFSPRLVLLVLGLGCLGSVIPYLLYTRGLAGTENSTASMLATAEPLVASLSSVLLFHEPMTVFCGVGICLILSGIIIMSLPRRAGGGSHSEK